ncbi:MAG: hypothetical protein HY553_00810 [Elusimicrobia bacterium]|nr:hypothetical protein [Elusimicrobiota bacterium]
MIGAILLYAGALALGLAALPVAKDYLLARVLGPLALVTALFFVEHFHGLGRLAWAGPVAAGALTLWLWPRRPETWAAVREHRGIELACAAGFLWALTWRWRFPDIDAVSEKMTSLVMVAAFGAGERLPPVDPWLPPERLNVYYPLMHYAAGLAGRLLRLEPTHAINVCFCLVVGWISASAWAVIARRVDGLGARAACLASIALGGSGAAIAVPLMTRLVQWPTAVVRFLGEWGGSPPDPTPLGRVLAQGAESAHLPVETLAYYLALGDFHPPWGGWLLLLLGLYAQARALEPGDEAARAGYAGAALALVPLTAAVNAWTAPLQALVAAAGLAPLARTPRLLLRREAWLPPLLATAALAPFLAGFMGGAAGRNPMLAVARADRPTVAAWCLTFWPLAALLGAGLAAGGPARRRAWVWAGLLAVAELVYVNDLYTHPFNRFNTYMKWMPWLLVGVSADLAPLTLAGAGAAGRALCLAALLAPCVFAASLGRHKALWDSPNPGRLDGHAWLTNDPPAKAVLIQLRRSPGGVTLEYPTAMSYTRQSAVSLLSGHATYIGWPNHEVTWRGPRDDIWQRYHEAQWLYKDELRDPLRWLQERGIRHVVWLPAHGLDEERFTRLHARLSPRYEWREAYRAGPTRSGVWSLR